MPTFECNNDGTQPWFGRDNTLRLNDYCGNRGLGLDLRLPCTIASPSGVRSITVDVLAGRKTVGLLTSPRPLTNLFGGAGPIAGITYGVVANSIWYSGIPLNLYYDNPGVLTIYKSDAQHYTNTNFTTQAFPAQTLTNAVCGATVISDVTVKACTVTLTWGVSSFDFTVFAVNCYNFGNQYHYGFYILYENVIGHDVMLQGKRYIARTAGFTLSCPSVPGDVFTLSKTVDTWSGSGIFPEESAPTFGSDCGYYRPCCDEAFIKDIHVLY